MTNWEIHGHELANCNCSFGCPCQFGALPTYGNCDESFGLEIHTGHYGDTILDGLRAAGIFKFPGAIHDGNGEMQLIMDERANDAQRAPHRARINLPLGFEYDVAEAASGSTTTTGGAISLAKNNDTHAHLAKLNITGHGVIH